jgi:hypothetical protein
VIKENLAVWNFAYPDASCPKIRGYARWGSDFGPRKQGKTIKEEKQTK